jgi:hypothetical protein
MCHVCFGHTPRLRGTDDPAFWSGGHSTVRYASHVHTLSTNVAIAKFRISVIIFSALRIAYLPEYLLSPNPTYFGIPTSIYAIAEAHASIITATTPLLRYFVLRFKYVGASGPITSRPIFAFSVRRRDSSDEPPVSGTRSNFTEREKTTASSSSGEDTRPRTGDCLPPV